jgi:uncharacterized protein YoxC
MTLTISVAVIAAIMVIVGIVAIVALIYIIRLVKSATSLIDAAKMHLAPVSRDITVISQKTSAILDSVHHQVESVEQSINTVKDMTTRVRQFEEDLLKKAVSPLLGAVSYWAAFRKGFQVFFNVLRK